MELLESVSSTTLELKQAQFMDTLRGKVGDVTAAGAAPRQKRRKSNMLPISLISPNLQMDLHRHLMKKKTRKMLNQLNRLNRILNVYVRHVV